MTSLINSNAHELSSLPLFAGVAPEVLALITPEMVRHYKHDEVIFYQGGAADSLVILLRGDAQIIADGVYLVRRQPYEIIGEQAFINESYRTATAVAQGLVQALVIPRHIVARLMEETAFNHNLLRVVSDKLSQATNERAYRFRVEELLFTEFRAHLSPEIMDRLLSRGEDYGKPRYIDAIILFSDIRCFTERSAGMTPEEIALQLSPYLDSIVDTIHDHEGLVDKFVGDAVMAIWGFAPGADSLAIQALDCARAMVEQARSMTFGGQPIAIGVGLNAGRVFIGNVGGDGKRQFTVLGSPVNLAARYESETKTLGVPIVVGQDFYERLPGERQRCLTAHAGRELKGAEPQTLYTYNPAVCGG
jgi:class 3 adenylate cyclase